MVILELIRFAFAFLVVAFAPGWLLLSLWRRQVTDTTISGAFTIALSFSLSIALVTFLALIGWALSVPLNALVWLLLAVAVAGIGLNFYWGAFVLPEPNIDLISERFQRRDIAFFGPWILVIIVIGLVIWQGVWMNTAGDQFYHIAAIRYLLTEEAVLVEGLIYADVPSGLDPTSGTWHTAMAVMVRISGLDIIDFWRLVPLFTAPLIVLAFYNFASHLLGSRGLALAATALQFVVFWALDFRDAAFSNHVGYILVWTALTLTLLHIRQRNYWYAAGAIVIAGALGLLHLVMAQFFFVSLSAFLVGLALFAAKPEKRRELILGAQVLLAALVIALPLILIKTIDIPTGAGGGISTPG